MLSGYNLAGPTNQVRHFDLKRLRRVITVGPDDQGRMDAVTEPRNSVPGRSVRTPVEIPVRPLHVLIWLYERSADYAFAGVDCECKGQAVAILR